jgi:hypothetical protein
MIFHTEEDLTESEEDNSEEDLTESEESEEDNSEDSEESEEDNQIKCKSLPNNLKPNI